MLKIKNFLLVVLAVIFGIIIILLPYGISKLIVDGIDKSNAKRGL